MVRALFGYCGARLNTSTTDHSASFQAASASKILSLRDESLLQDQLK
jgi:hypothetical protein